MESKASDATVALRRICHPSARSNADGETQRAAGCIVHASLVHDARNNHNNTARAPHGLALCHGDTLVTMTHSGVPVDIHSTRVPLRRKAVDGPKVHNSCITLIQHLHGSGAWTVPPTLLQFPFFRSNDVSHHVTGETWKNTP